MNYLVVEDRPHRSAVVHAHGRQVPSADAGRTLIARCRDGPPLANPSESLTRAVAGQRGQAPPECGGASRGLQ